MSSARTPQSKLHRRFRSRLLVEELEARLCLAHNPFLFVTSYGTDSVMRYDQSTALPKPAHGQTGATFVPTGSGGLTVPLTMLFLPDGTLLVDSGEDNDALRYDGHTGAFINVFMQPNDGGVFIPTGMLLSPDRTHFFAASNATNKIIRWDYDGAGGISNPTTFVSDPDMNGPAGMVFGPDGNLYVSSLNNSKILRYDGTTGAPKPARRQTGATFVPGGSGGLDRAAGVTFGTDGNLYVSSENTDEIMRYNGKTGTPLPANGQTGAVFTPSPNSCLDRPAGLLFGPGSSSGTQDIYVISVNTNAVVRIDGPSGTSLCNFVTPGSGGLNAPRSLIFGNTDPSTLGFSNGPGYGGSGGSSARLLDGIGALTAGQPVRVISGPTGATTAIASALLVQAGQAEGTVAAVASVTSTGATAVRLAAPAVQRIAGLANPLVIDWVS
jgi:sugar lactone lactonase YvrE